MNLMVKIGNHWVTGITAYDETKWAHRNLRKAWEREGCETRVDGEAKARQAA